MLSLWDILIVAALILALLLVVVVLIAYLPGDGRADPPSQIVAPPRPVAAWPTPVAVPPKQVATTPPIVIRTTAGDRGQISIRYDDTKPIGIRLGPLFQPPTNGSFIETREVKEDLDLYCKLTGRIVRDCNCVDCRELKASIGN